MTVAVASLATGMAVDGLIGTGMLPESALVPAATAAKDAAAHVHHEGGEIGGSWFETACAVALLLVLVNALRPRSRSEEDQTMVEDGEQVVELKVSGMHCNGCVQSVRRALSEVAGVTEAEVWLDEGLARVRERGSRPSSCSPRSQHSVLRLRVDEGTTACPRITQIGSLFLVCFNLRFLRGDNSIVSVAQPTTSGGHSLREAASRRHYPDFLKGIARECPL